MQRIGPSSQVARLRRAALLRSMGPTAAVSRLTARRRSAEGEGDLVVLGDSARSAVTLVSAKIARRCFTTNPLERASRDIATTPPLHHPPPATRGYAAPARIRIPSSASSSLMRRSSMHGACAPPGPGASARARPCGHNWPLQHKERVGLAHLGLGLALAILPRQIGVLCQRAVRPVLTSTPQLSPAWGACEWQGDLARLRRIVLRLVAVAIVEDARGRSSQSLCLHVHVSGRHRQLLAASIVCSWARSRWRQGACRCAARTCGTRRKSCHPGYVRRLLGGPARPGLERDVKQWCHSLTHLATRAWWSRSIE